MDLGNIILLAVVKRKVAFRKSIYAINDTYVRWTVILDHQGEHSPSPWTSIIETHLAGEHESEFWGITFFQLLPYIQVGKHCLQCSLLKFKVSPQFTYLSPIRMCEETWSATLTLEIIELIMHNQL